MLEVDSLPAKSALVMLLRHLLHDDPAVSACVKEFIETSSSANASNRIQVKWKQIFIQVQILHDVKREQ